MVKVKFFRGDTHESVEKAFELWYVENYRKYATNVINTSIASRNGDITLLVVYQNCMEYEEYE